MNYKEEIKRLEKNIELNEEKIELNKKYNVFNLSMQNSLLEDEIRQSKTLINLFQKFAKLPENALNIPSKTIGFYIDYEGDGLELRPCFKEDTHSKLYNYICDSYSEWTIQIEKFIEASFYNIFDIPRLLIKVQTGYWVSSLEKRCDLFYDSVIEFIDFLNNDDIGKAVLNSIDAYYLGLIEAGKKREE